MARTESQDTNSSETVMMDDTESRVLEDNASRGIPDRGDSEDNDQEESGESTYYSDRNFDLAKDDSDNYSQAREMMHINPFTTVALEEDQMILPDPSPALHLTPPPKELAELWAKQHCEFNILLAENKDLEEKIDSLGIENNALQEDLSKVKTVNNQLEPTNQRLKNELERCTLDNEKLRELIEDLRRTLLERVAEVGRITKELSQTNDERRRELKATTNAIQVREKTIEALKADGQRVLEIEVSRKKALEAELDKLRDDIKRERERSKELVAEQRERAKVMPETPTARQDGKEKFFSLQDEMWVSESVDAEERDERGKRVTDRVAYSTYSTADTQPSEPLQYEKRSGNTPTSDKTRPRRYTTEVRRNPKTSASSQNWVECRTGTTKIDTPLPDVAVQTDLQGQTKVQSAQIGAKEGELKVNNCKSSVARNIEYSSVAWWMLLLYLGLLWWFSQGDKQLWMQANEITRRSVAEMRDERWAEPAWLGRMRFYADSKLGIDRSMFT